MNNEQELKDEQIIKIMENAVANGKRLSKQEAWRLMEEATEQGKDLAMVWKIPSKTYEKWFNENKEHLGTTLEEETTYLVYSGEKAFNGHMGGFSIFAVSLGARKRKEHYYSLDRIEHFGCEWAVIVEVK